MGEETDFETSFETNTPRQVERLDVIETPGGKRRGTPEARARIIAESMEPGANVAAVARRHGLYPQQLYTWRRGVQERAEAMRFVPAMVERGEATRPVRSGAATSGEIVIETATLAIRIPAGVSADHIERVLLTQPVDFRKGMVGLASLVQSELRLDPFSGMLFIFRARRADRIKLLLWDGTGLVLVTKRLQDGKFRWPRPGDGVMKLSAAQASALIEGLDWSRVHVPRVPKPLHVQ